jgi:hypothetical protein
MANSTPTLTSRGRSLELSQLDEKDLELACLGRIAALTSLIDRTADPEEFDRLRQTRTRMNVLLKRLRDL